MCLLPEEPSTPTRSQVDTSRQTERRASQPPRTSPPNRRLNATRPTSRTDGNQRRRTSSRAPACHPGAGATSRVSCGRYTAIRALLPAFWNFEIRERPVTGSTVVVVPSAEVVTVFVLTAAGAEATTTSDVATASSATRSTSASRDSRFKPEASEQEDRASPQRRHTSQQAGYRRQTSQ